jgi:N,N-dimethylformamidase beta subunit-like protein
MATRESLRSRRQRQAAFAVAFGVAIAAALVLVDAKVLGAGPARPVPLLAGFGKRSYEPGKVAVLRIGGGVTRRATLQLFLAGAVGTSHSKFAGWDKPTFGKPVTAPRQLRRPATGQWNVRIRLGASWASGDYVARLSWRGHQDYAPFILRPSQLGTAPVLVIEPTNTWHAYDNLGGDSWYLDPAVHDVDLTHPFTATDIRGAPVPAGLPEQFWRLDVGFLRWYWPSGYRADFFSDDDLEGISSVQQLLRYRLIVFAGHEEYVTSHVYDLITQYRNAGGNLAFLSANNFFYRVEVHGNTMVGRTRWRDIGRPESALVGAQYIGWNQARWPNHPYRVVDTLAAPWLFQGTGFTDGTTFGDYGVEIDEPNEDSPDGTKVLAEVPDEFGPGKPADMTIYRQGRATVFDAGVFNFGASAHWAHISQMVSNLWSHLSGERPGR